MDEFSESVFRSKVDASIQRVKTILDNERHPDYASEVPHQYVDKFLLAELLTNAALAAELNCLEALGIDSKKLKTFLSWSKSRSVTLRLKAEQRCEFLREIKREENSSFSVVTQVVGLVTKTDKVVRTVSEYYWDFSAEYELFAFQGNNPSDKITLISKKVQTELKTTSNTTPYPQSTVFDSLDFNFTYFLQHVTDNFAFKFIIDRTVDSCRTPRRNDDIYGALFHFSEFSTWAKNVANYFLKLIAICGKHDLDTSKINCTGLFVPILPLFEKDIPKEKDVSSNSLVGIPPSVGSPLTSVNDVNRFLDEQKRAINEKFSEFGKMYPDNILTAAKIQLVAFHIQDVCQQYQGGVDYIEQMLFSQLEAAIGKIVLPEDFSAYMRYHNKVIFRREFEPKPFCYAIRRPNFYPEGIISIDGQLSGGTGIPEPILTHVKSSPATHPMKFPINAATNVTFNGERHLHACVLQEFSGQSGLTLSFEARARQFSIFLVLIGRIASRDLFLPNMAFLVQNKDDIKIPLNMETIPTPKEFRDAIESLSPEQQRFAKAFRAMQLSSTLFGILVIQVKPQLEKVLKIPPFSLTKEIKLTQELLELFITYQIPSDLLSYDGTSVEKSAALNRVNENVRKLFTMINEEKNKELERKREEEKMRRLKMEEEGRRLREEERRLREEEESRRDYSDNKVLISARSYKKSSSPFGAIFKSLSSFGGEKKMARSYDSSIAPSISPTLSPAPLPETKTSTLQSEQPVVIPSEQPLVEQQQSEQKKIPEHQKSDVAQRDEDTDDEIEDNDPNKEDYTQYPPALDAKYEALDEDSSLRPTIINIGETWTKSSQKSLLSTATTQDVGKDGQVSEKNKALDLLDAISRSGSLSVDSATLHVVIAATHTFTKSVVNTVIEDNINPIEKVERSNLILATTVHNRQASEILSPTHVSRVATFSPQLFPADSTGNSILGNRTPALPDSSTTNTNLVTSIQQQVKA